ncbi:dephospho-CoA kinase [uncultured Actinomyces sp.]|uniref:dephospho-CoA kinase n=1 Tax=uncultured Actinomyces sp. TaxID=249061 RepID=UPI0028E68BA7|nr:dephospho-CoA kinase [uncultured Actinomyces sp.]
MKTVIQSGGASAYLLRSIPPARTQGPALFLALSGGIGAGKSTIAHVLRGLGVFVVDADQLAREVLSPFHPVYEAVLAHFGADLAFPDGSLDRRLLAQRAFSSPESTSLLNLLTHPAISALAWERLKSAPQGGCALYDVPLLTTYEDASLFDVVIMVSAPEELRVERLISRGLSEVDARARIRSQISDSERRKLATIWVENLGNQEDLAEVSKQLYSCWLTRVH